MKLRFLGNLKRSLTAKITLSIAVISILLIAGAGPMITRLATRELREGNELIMFANLALLREDLAAARFDLTQEPERLVKRMDLQLGSLPMALLDEQRRSVGRSERFEVPVSTPPAQPMPVDNVPTGIEHADVRALGKAPGPLTTVWTWADGRSFRLLFARIPAHPGAARFARRCQRARRAGGVRARARIPAAHLRAEFSPRRFACGLGDGFGASRSSSRPWICTAAPRV